MRKIIIEYGAVALSPTKKTNRSLPKGIERFAAFVYNKIAKNHQQESEDNIPSKKIFPQIFFRYLLLYRKVILFTKSSTSSFSLIFSTKKP